LPARACRLDGRGGRADAPAHRTDGYGRSALERRWCASGRACRRAENADHARRPRQHDEGADSRQRRWCAGARGVLVQDSRDVMLWLGVGIMVGSETATLWRVEPFYSWNTPIAWTGFILFADSIVFRARGDSWIHSAPREFALLTLVSIPLWLVFEGYNRVIDNWYY